MVDYVHSIISEYKKVPQLINHTTIFKCSKIHIYVLLIQIMLKYTWFSDVQIYMIFINHKYVQLYN